MLLLAIIAPRALTPASLPDLDGAAILVTVTEVEPDRATLWLRAEGDRRARIAYRPEDGTAESTAAEEVAPRPESDSTGRLVLRRLRPGTRYRYEIEVGEERVAGVFRTAPAATDDQPVRFVWSGDLGGAGHCRDAEDGYRIFRAMARQHADFFLFLGDTAYVDQPCGGPSPAQAGTPEAVLGAFHAKHRYNRADRIMQRFLRTTPVYAIWDDHEVGNNFAGSSEPLMPIGRRAFQDYWAIDGPPEEPGRLYRRVRWGRHVELFILDTRQYRSPNTDHDGPAKTMLGDAQRRWLLESVERSDATWKVIVTSVPLGMFTGGAFSDSWSNVGMLGFPRPGVGFVHERNLILRTLRERRVTNLVFLSGDVHHAELIRHEPVAGWVVHEFVAGPLAARQGFRRLLDRSLGSRSLGSLGWAHNFGEIAVDGETLAVRILDISGTPRVALRLPVTTTVN